MADTGERLPERLRVFISYSRRDTDMIDQLVAALDVAGFEPQLDRLGTSAGEEWQPRLRDMIGQCDTVVFALTPDAAVSSVCEWEVEETQRLGKRLIPIVIKPLGGVAVPERLSRLDYSFFYPEPSVPGSGFGEGLRKLVAALRVDVDWMREGTRLGELARRWEAGGSATNRLLSGADIALAKTWLTRTPRDVPPPPAVVRRFIEASEAHEVERQVAEAAQAARLRDAELASANARLDTARQVQRRTRLALFAVSLVAAVAIGAGMLAWTQRQAAEQQRRETEALRRATQITESGLLSRTATSLLATDPVSAMLLALEGMPDPAAGVDRPWVSETHVALDQALRLAKERLVAPHPPTPYAIALSPDGRFLATLSDKTRLIEVATGREIKLARDEGGLSTVVFTADGRLLGASPEGRTVRVFEPQTGKTVARCRLDDGAAEAAGVGFGRDGEFFATTARGDVHVFETAGCRRLSRVVDKRVSYPVLSPDRRFMAMRSDLRRVSIYRIDGGGLQAEFEVEGRLQTFSGDGQAVVTASSDGILRYYAADTGARINQAAYDKGLGDAAFSLDGRILATMSHDGALRLSDIATGETLARYTHAAAGPAHDITFSADGRFVATVSGVDSTVRVFETAPGAALARYEFGKAVRSLAFSADGQRAAAASAAGARLLDMTSLEEIASIGPDRDPKMEDDRLYTVAFSPDGRIMAVGSATARLFASASGQFQRRLGVRGSIDSIVFSPDNTLVATPGRGQARVFTIATGEELELPAQDGGVVAVAFSPDGRTLATGSDNGTVLLYDIATRSERARLRHDRTIGAVVFSPDGQTLAAAGRDGTVLLVEVATGRQRLKLPHREFLVAIAFSRDGRKLMTADEEPVVHVLDVATGKEVMRLAHHGEVHAIASSPDGRLVATGAADGSVRLFDLQAGTELARLAHDSGALAVAFSRDGSLVGSGGNDGTMRLWRVFPDARALVEASKANAARCLTPQQRLTYFLPPAPPTWCVERRLWPYHTDSWQAWLADRKAGRNPSSPTQ